MAAQGHQTLLDSTHHYDSYARIAPEESLHADVRCECWLIGQCGKITDLTLIATFAGVNSFDPLARWHLLSAILEGINNQKRTAMRTTQKQRREVIDRLAMLGIGFENAGKLRRIAMTLSRWGELECGDGNDYCSWSIERDESTGKPYKCFYPHSGPSRRYPVPDREKGALRRLEALMVGYSDLWAFHQTDPRGASLYVGSKEDVNGTPIDKVYNRGVAIY